MQKGGVISDTLEAIIDLAADSSKAMGSEPFKILGQALGNQPDNEAGNPHEKGIFASAPGTTKNPQSNLSDRQLESKKIDEGVRVQKLLSLHRQRLKEEVASFEESKAGEEQAFKKEKAEKEQQKQAEIVQLRRQEAKDEVLSATSATKGPVMPGAVKQAKKLTGTKEVGKAIVD